MQFLKAKKLEDGIDEWCEGRSLCEDQNDSEESHEEENGEQPPLLSHVEEHPKITEDGKFAHVRSKYR